MRRKCVLLNSFDERRFRGPDPLKDTTLLFDAINLMIQASLSYAIPQKDAKLCTRPLKSGFKPGTHQIERNRFRNSGHIDVAPVLPLARLGGKLGESTGI